MRTKLVAINLDPAVHARLAQQAKAEERTPAQQVAWLVKQALREAPASGERPPGRAVADAR